MLINQTIRQTMSLYFTLFNMNQCHSRLQEKREDRVQHLLLQYLIYSVCWVSCCLKIIAPGSKQRVDLSVEIQDCRLGRHPHISGIIFVTILRFEHPKNTAWPTPTRISHHLCDLKDCHQTLTHTSHLFRCASIS